VTTQITTTDKGKININVEELNKKIVIITNSQRPYIQKILLKLSERNPINAESICDYILSEQVSFNIKESTKEGKIKVLVWLSEFLQDKYFKDMEREDILSFLLKLKKPISEDPKQTWIGSYNIRQLIIVSFFKWLFEPNEHDYRLRKTPLCIKGIKKLQNKNISRYTPSDLWTENDISLFLKYSPNKRDRCYHAMAFDLSARPSELLSLRVGDIQFKITNEGIQYAEVEIKGGKTGGSRIIPLIDSIPYVKDWIKHGHPTGTNPNSWLFVSPAKGNYGSKLTYDGLLKHYKDFYKKSFFPKLLLDETIPPADRAYIKNILTKPFALYNLRHSALTEKSKILKEHVLRNHAGWSINSKMPQTYIHYFGNESSVSLLQAKGIVKENQNSEQKDILKPKYCVHCGEINKKFSQFCIKCKMIFSYDAYTDTLEKQKQKDNDIEELKRSVAFLSDRFNAFLLSQSGNRLVYYNNDEDANGNKTNNNPDPKNLKGIELKPEINNKAIGKVIPKK
jgi:integrase